MPMLCLTGTYRIAGTEPDGDSIRFYPDDPAAVGARAGKPTRCATNAGGGAQLRLDAIDALETHYSPRAACRFINRSSSRTRPPTNSCAGWASAGSSATAKR